MSFLTTGNCSESGYSLNPVMYEALSISEPNLNSGVVKAVRIIFCHVRAFPTNMVSNLCV